MVSVGLRSRAMTVLVVLVGLVAVFATPMFDARGATAPPSSATTPSAAAVTPGTGTVAKLQEIATPRALPYAHFNWSAPDDLLAFRNAAGRLELVAHDAGATSLTVDTYDATSWAPVGSRRTISLSGWPLWGGFYAAPDGYRYVLVGRQNPNEDDALAVVAIRRYDANWKLVGTATLPGGVTSGIKGIYEPFAASSSHMTLVGTRLVGDMGRLLYAISGVHHQADLAFEVDVTTMTAKPLSALGGAPYSSHSFNAFVATRGSQLAFVEHGDAYPRAIQFSVIPSYPTSRKLTSYNVFEIKGATGNNATGVTLDGVASGTLGMVAVGSSSRQIDPPDPSKPHNIFAVWVNPANGNHKLTWLTTLGWQGTSTAEEPRVVPVGTDLFAVLFTVTNGSAQSLNYRLIDSTGAVKATASWPSKSFFAGGQPVPIGGQLYWIGAKPATTSGRSVAWLYGMDVSTPTKPVLIGKL
jgi:hypothetical protein